MQVKDIALCLGIKGKDGLKFIAGSNMVCRESHEH